MKPETLLFESQQALLLHQALHQDSGQRALSLDTLLAIKPFPNREALLQSWLPETLHGDVPILLNTLVQLREALILAHEHVDHCFQELADTPKNKLLRILLHRYLESELSQDRTGHIWSQIEQIRNSCRFSGLNGRVVAIPTSSPSLLFLEFLQSLKQVPGIEIVSLANGEASLFLWSSQEEALTEIAKLAARASPPVAIPFAGSPKARLFLKAQLASQGISVCDWFPQPNDKTLDGWQQLRREKLPLLERLEKSRKYLHGDKTCIATEWDKITEKPPPSATLHLFPLTLIIPGEGEVFTYCDDSLLESEDPLYLSASEREKLFLAGYPLPRPHDTAKRRLETLTQMPGTVFWTLPRESSPRPTQELKPQREEFQRKKPNFQAAVTVKAFSATALETFRDCPAKYFLSNRMKLRSALATEGSAALYFGQAVHLALERYLLNQTLSLPSLFATALQEVAPNFSSDSTLGRILTIQFKKIAIKVALLEKQLSHLFPGASPFRLEEGFLEERDGISLTGKIDRIDRLPNGTALILDYKTGKVDFSPEHMAKGKNFQALLYLLGGEAIAKSPVAGILFYDLKKGELRRGLVRESYCGPEVKKNITRGHTVSEEKWERLIHEGKQQLGKTVEEIKKGNFTPTPEMNLCSYCDGAPLCRRADGYQ